MERVLTLDCCIDKISKDEFQEMIAIAIHFLLHLATTADFLGVKYERGSISDEDIALSLSQSKNAQFVGALFFKLLLLIRYNNLPVSIFFFV